LWAKPSPQRSPVEIGRRILDQACNRLNAAAFDEFVQELEFRGISRVSSEASATAPPTRYFGSVLI
jgi:hypothetical protein